MQRDGGKGHYQVKEMCGKIKGTNYLLDTTDFKKRLKRTEFPMGFENTGNYRITECFRLEGTLKIT